MSTELGILWDRYLAARQVEDIAWNLPVTQERLGTGAGLTQVFTIAAAATDRAWKAYQAARRG
jgi:hypothetical protein